MALKLFKLRSRDRGQAGGDLSADEDSGHASLLDAGEAADDGISGLGTSAENDGSAFLALQDHLPHKRRKRKRKAYYDFGMRMKKRKKGKFMPAPALDERDLPTQVTGETESSVLGPGADIVADGSSMESLTGSSSPCAGKSMNHTSKSRRQRNWRLTCCACGKQVPKVNQGQYCNDAKGAHQLCSDRRSERLVIKRLKLPFQDLPTECKLLVFSFLAPLDRGLAARVCQEWALLVRSPSLWSRVELHLLADAMIQAARRSPSKRSSKTNSVAVSDQCVYNTLKKRLVAYLDYLNGIRPCLRHLAFKLDIASSTDEWYRHVVVMILHARCRNLKSLHCDWTCTPQRQQLESFCCTANKTRTMFRRHFQRVRAFQELWGLVTENAPYLENIHLPFDWSPRSVLFLCRLKYLHTLRLGGYFSLEQLSQQLLNTVLSSLPLLRNFRLEVRLPRFSSRLMYNFSHPSIVTLDISACQGLFLKSLNLPQLRYFTVGRLPWQGPLVSEAENVIPCLYGLLQRGAPELVMLNKHRVKSGWRDGLYDELKLVLRRVCPCKEHSCNAVE